MFSFPLCIAASLLHQWYFDTNCIFDENCHCYSFWKIGPITMKFSTHNSDIIKGAMASQITSLTIVYSAVYSGADQRKSQSSASLAFVRRIHLWPGNSQHNGPVTRKMFPFDDVIMVMLLFLAWFKGKYKQTYFDWLWNFTEMMLVGWVPGQFTAGCSL